MDLFRKISLEKISSPEQLDRQILLIPRSFWLVLAGSAFLLAAAFLWGFFGSIVVYEEAAGIAVESGEGKLLCFVPPEVGNQLRSGMRMKVRALGGGSGQERYLEGEIESVQAKVADSDELEALLQNDQLEAYFTGDGPVQAVFGTLSEEEASDFPEGTLLEVRLITEEKAPLSLLLPEPGGQ